MIAAPHSGSGKTIISLALLRAFKRVGLDIRAAKAGPDYIDPTFHEISSGRPSVNLDPWAMSPERCRYLAGMQAEAQDFLLVESMMGLFDGALDGSGSGADLAHALDIPVVLVVDAAKQSQSIAALVRGFRDHDHSIRLCGVILNRVGSNRHETMLRHALADIDVSVLGAVRRNSDLELPERHLGLVQAGEIDSIEEFIETAATQIADECDLESLIKCFQPVQGAKLQTGKKPNGMVPPPGQNIAIACDQAFSFIYPHLLSDWRNQGAHVSFFSPLANEGPGLDADAVFLPGGYPELHGAKLSNSNQFISLMEKARLRDSLIYGECGGYMVLGGGLIDKKGIRHQMLGFLQLETSFEKRKLHLGYRIIEPLDRFFAGSILRAHEFHYTSAIKQNGSALFKAKDATGNSLSDQGLIAGNVMGSYMHLIDAGEFL
ncbi:MAG: cobyrinate a,c-diamide synthase [Hyphomicrobiales bacterium]|nr:cobyrinate a,c-diamide synthase [Hyphomicrobiales bacterium]